MPNHGGQIPVIRERAGKACGSKECWTPPFPFPPPGESRGGRVPPTPGHAARPAKSAGTHRAPAPPTRGLPPPCASPAQRVGAGFMRCRDLAGLKRRADFGRVVYTEYLTLPVQSDNPLAGVIQVVQIGDGEPILARSHCLIAFEQQRFGFGIVLLPSEAGAQQALHAKTF